MFESALRAFHVRKGIRQGGETLRVSLNARGDGSVRMWALNLQDSHGTLLVDLLC